MLKRRGKDQPLIDQKECFDSNVHYRLCFTVKEPFLEHSLTVVLSYEPNYKIT